MKVVFENYSPGNVLACMKAVEVFYGANVPELMVHDGELSIYVYRKQDAMHVRCRPTKVGFKAA